MLVWKTRKEYNNNNDILDLFRELGKNYIKMIGISIMVGALRTTPKNLEKDITELMIRWRIEAV